MPKVFVRLPVLVADPALGDEDALCKRPREDLKPRLDVQTRAVNVLESIRRASDRDRARQTDVEHTAALHEGSALFADFSQLQIEIQTSA